MLGIGLLGVGVRLKNKSLIEVITQKTGHLGHILFSILWEDSKVCCSFICDSGFLDVIRHFNG